MTDASVVLDDQTRRELGRWWWLYLLFGIVTAVVGVIVIIRPMTGVFGLAVIIAIGFFVSGLADIVGVRRWSTGRWVPILWGVLSIAAGVVTIVWPDITLWALAVLIGIAFIVRGVVRLFGAFSLRPHLWGLWALLGVVELGVGILAIAWPGITILILAVIIGIDLVILGIAEIALSLEARRLAAS